MADTTFVDGDTSAANRVVAAWLNDVNNNTYRAMVNAKLAPYGATGNGTTDDTTAIQLALNASVLAYGGEVYLPPGTYAFTSLTIPAGVTIVGAGPYATTLLATNATNTCLALSDSSSIRNVKIMKTVAKTAGFLCSVEGNGCVIDNCEFGGYYVGVSVGTYGGTIRVTPRISNCKFRSPGTTIGSGAIQLINVSSAELYNNTITGDVGTQPGFGVRVYSGDTVYIDNCNVTAHGKALLVDTPAGGNLYALTIDSSFFDSAGTTIAAPVSCAEFVPEGNVYDTKISNTWFGLSAARSGCIIEPTGAGTVDGISFSGCEFIANGDSGIYWTAAATNVVITGGWACANVAKGILAKAGTTKFTITGVFAGPSLRTGSSVTNDYGIAVDIGASNNYCIVGNNVVGNTTVGLFDGGTGATKLVRDNLGYVPRAPGKMSNIPIGPVAYNALGTSAVHVAGTIYIAEMYLTAGKAIIGVGVLNGGTVGTDNLIVGIYGPEGGAVLANSALAGTLSAGANAFQEIPLTALFTAPCEGVYWVAVQCSGTTTTTRRIAANTYLNLTKSFAGAFGTLGSLTVPTTFTADVGPIAYVY